MTGNAILAVETLGHLTGVGVNEFVICAGARNVPLVASLLRGAEENDCRVVPHFDERTAAFYAMGLARNSGKPVAVVTTSGTAVAELLPAVIESYYSGVPLIVVSADRPESFRGSGAPQAIEQAGLFGRYTTCALDVSASADLAGFVEWDRRSPAHLNVCFEEPLVEDVVDSWSEIQVPATAPASDSTASEALDVFCLNATRPLILLGSLEDSWRPLVEQFLKQTGFPFWAEATSGLRESPLVAKQQVASEASLAGLDPGAILRIGGVPSCRFWRDLEHRPDLEVLSVSRLPFTGLARLSRLLECDMFPVTPEATQQGWVEEKTLFNDARLEEALTRHPASEPAMVRELSRVVPSEALVFLGNSMPIRNWNLAASREHQHRRCVASRGANGIDGQIATFLGLANGEEESWGVFGDLTALYDLNAPALLANSSGEKKRIVILNNGGGRIFSRLPSMSGLALHEKEQTENHHNRTFRAWAEMWDLDYVEWIAGKVFPSVEGDVAVIEVTLDNVATEAFWKAGK